MTSFHTEKCCHLVNAHVSCAFATESTVHSYVFIDIIIIIIVLHMCQNLLQLFCINYIVIFCVFCRELGL